VDGSYQYRTTVNISSEVLIFLF